VNRKDSRWQVVTRTGKAKRRRPARPLVLGLTGSIGMGKSTAAKAFRRLGIPVFSSDEAVHRLLAAGGRGVAPVAAAFPKARAGAAISRPRLAAEVFGNPTALARLEGILHPLVWAETDRFVAAARRCRRPLVVLDVPLLYETKGETRAHAVAVVTAPPFVQRARVLGRSGQTAVRLAAILERQMPDREKRRRADFLVPTGGSRRESLRRLARIVVLLKRGSPKRKRR
jgi:dephospho-CoA kinase